MYTLQHHPPSGGAVLTNNDSTVIGLTLANDDLNELKILTDLVTSENTTYLILTRETVQDMRGNSLNISNLPLMVDGYERDMTHPQLTAFDLDVDTGKLTLSFSETVNASSLSINEITLQPSEDENTTAFSYSLQHVYDPPEGTFSNSTDGPVIVVYLGDNDLNEVKRIPELATLDANTFITLSALIVMDMVGLELVPVQNGNATRVQHYEPDVTDPELLSFNFDLDSGLLELTFDETVNAETLDNTRITRPRSMLPWSPL